MTFLGITRTLDDFEIFATGLIQPLKRKIMIDSGKFIANIETNTLIAQRRRSLL